MSYLITHIINALENANKNKSKVDEDILKMNGMSGKKTRHFYNNLCSMEDARYLEIGLWKGSTLCSAMCNNENLICLGIDNWSEFGGPKNVFNCYFNKYKVDKAKFIEKDSWDVDVKEIGKFNIYVYDGHHSEESQYKALSHYLDCLDDEFIFIIDDWNLKEVENGTLNSIKDNNLKILYHHEIFTNNRQHPPFGDGEGDRAFEYGDWHNGIGIFVLSKKI